MNKKLITILMSGLMVFSMVACGGTETKEKENRAAKGAEIVIKDKLKEITVELENDEIVYLRNEDGKAKLLTTNREEIEIVGDVDWDKGGEYKVKFKYGNKEIEKMLFVGSESEIKEQKEKIAKETKDTATKESENKETEKDKPENKQATTTENSQSSIANNSSTPAPTPAPTQQSETPAPTQAPVVVNTPVPTPNPSTPQPANTHTHNFQPVYRTVHHDAEYKTETIHHDAEYKTVHHDAEYQMQQVPYTEYVPHSYHVCSCGARFNTSEELSAHQIPNNIAWIEWDFGDGKGVQTIQSWQCFPDPECIRRAEEYAATHGVHGASSVVTENEAITKYKEEKVKVKDAWDEQILVKAAWDEQKQVKVKDAWDEQVLDHYECSCGAKQ